MSELVGGTRRRALEGLGRLDEMKRVLDEILTQMDEVQGVA
jgi:hypothetical protein